MEDYGDDGPYYERFDWFRNIGEVIGTGFCRCTHTPWSQECVDIGEIGAEDESYVER